MAELKFNTTHLAHYMQAVDGKWKLMSQWEVVNGKLMRCAHCDADLQMSCSSGGCLVCPVCGAKVRLPIERGGLSR